LARFGSFFRPALDRFLHIFGLLCPVVFKIWVETRNKLCKTGGEATSLAARVLDIGSTKVFHGAGRKKQLRHALPLWTVSGLQKNLQTAARKTLLERFGRLATLGKLEPRRALGGGVLWGRGFLSPWRYNRGLDAISTLFCCRTKLVAQL